MAMTKTRRRSRATASKQSSQAFVEALKRRLSGDHRSHAEFLADMRAKQSAGRLANPATAALLDRLERAIAS